MLSDVETMLPPATPDTAATAAAAVTGGGGDGVEETRSLLPVQLLDDAARLISTHTSSNRFMDEQLVYYHFTLFASSVSVWIGTAPPSMTSLHVALQTPFDSQPSVTTLLSRGDTVDDDGDDFGARLTSRLTTEVSKMRGGGGGDNNDGARASSKPYVVHLSYNVVGGNRLLEAHVQCSVVEQLRVLHADGKLR
jgi:hypothetical protein